MDEKSESVSDQTVNYYNFRTSEINAEVIKTGRNPYPNKFYQTLQIEKFIVLYGKVNKSLDGNFDKVPDKTLGVDFKSFEESNIIQNNTFIGDKEECIIGRVSLIRNAGKKLIFMTIMGDGFVLQLLANQIYYGDTKLFNEISNSIRKGDIVGATGYPGRSRSGELSLYITKIERLAPCLYDIPSSFSGIIDSEVRVRQRYLDFIVNQNSRHPFIIRAKILKGIRNYLDGMNFTEVTTPILSAKVGGAAAQPFETFHNDLKIPLFMRVAPELYLKQLIIGGFERVYEIGQQFRNESITYKHNPEFTSLEFYMVGADYYMLILMCEEMLKQLVFTCNGSLMLKYETHNKKEIMIDFEKFHKIDMMTELEKELNIKFPYDYMSEEMKLLLIRECEKYEIHCQEPKTIAKLIDKLVGHFIEPKCIHPTFIMNHPKVMSPLAKPHRSNSQLTERFELFICGMEFANAYTELNDPEIQKCAFENQMKDRKLGELEVPKEIDYDFIKALEFGMSPTAGFGLGIDRLSMLLANRSNIRDVILFPTTVPL